jgi:hypothetical protein
VDVSENGVSELYGTFVIFGYPILRQPHLQNWPWAWLRKVGAIRKKLPAKIGRGVNHPKKHIRTTEKVDLTDNTEWEPCPPMMETIYFLSFTPVPAAQVESLREKKMLSQCSALYWGCSQWPRKTMKKSQNFIEFLQDFAVV